MEPKIRVGIIGVSAERGWATLAHIPALKALPEYQIAAISNRHISEGIAAGKKHNVEFVYESSDHLIERSETDLIVVTVKVPQHKKLVTEALEAGKEVFCEWPLGNGLAETEEIVALAKQKGLKGFVGLQSRVVPAINYVKDLVEGGYVGQVLSTSLIGSGIYYGSFIDQASVWALDPVNGAGMIYTTFANSVDAMCFALGEFTELNATVAKRRSETTVIETGATVPMDIYDQIALNGVLEGGAVASVHFRGGLSKGTNFHWEINGTEGDLLITAGGGHPGVYEPLIKGASGKDEAMVELPVPERYYSISKELVPGPAHSVAENYARLASDLQHGTHLSASFDDALIRHRMINAIEKAAATGTKQRYMSPIEYRLS